MYSTILRADSWCDQHGNKRIGEQITSLLTASEGIVVPIAVEVLKRVSSPKLCGEPYVIRVVREIEGEIIKACEENLFCKTFLLKGDTEDLSEVENGTQMNRVAYEISEFNKVLGENDSEKAYEDILNKYAPYAKNI